MDTTSSMPAALPDPHDLVVATVGRTTWPSPLLQRDLQFVDDDHGVLCSSDTRNLIPYTVAGSSPPAFEEAGPRQLLAFDPSEVIAGVVTCGGLCPGLNDVIRSLTLTLRYGYGVRRVVGYRYGFAGIARPDDLTPLELTADVVTDVHAQGGSILATSRGPQDAATMVDTLERDGVSILFCIGGDGTLRGASAIAAEALRRGRRLAAVGVPKTIDNDVDWVERSFGFATAVEAAARTIVAAHAEARGAWDGIGLVKLMGRHSGFIAANATLARPDVNLCLVPELPFTLDGDGGVLDVLEERLTRRRHAVVVVAEGAGQELLAPADARDASGNVRDVELELRHVMDPSARRPRHLRHPAPPGGPSTRLERRPSRGVPMDAGHSRLRASPQRHRHPGGQRLPVPMTPAPGPVSWQ